MIVIVRDENLSGDEESGFRSEDEGSGNERGHKRSAPDVEEKQRKRRG